jgi:hypothetical protein
MTERQRKITESLAEKLAAGSLTVAELRRGVADLLLRNGRGRQDLLYLQSQSTSVASRVVGMMLIENGECSEGPPDPEDWPYKTALEAVRDGWRIINFPNMALLAVSADEPHGLGFEFILERWREEA